MIKPETLPVFEYPKKCGAMCAWKALSSVTWPRWSLYLNFQTRMLRDIKLGLGGAAAAWRLLRLFAFECYHNGARIALHYAIVAGLRGAAGGGTKEHLMYLHFDVASRPRRRRARRSWAVLAPLIS